jgi:transposase
MATMEKEDRPRARRWFLDEFKTDPVAMVLDGARKIVDDAEAIGVGEGAVRNWVRREGIERGERPGLTRDDRTEIVELRKENAGLRMERNLLERVTAFWVKESGQ